MSTKYKHYTITDLQRVRVQYRKNFAKLAHSVAKRDREKYGAEEKRLNALEKNIQSDLGVYTHGPNCPNPNMHCAECPKTTCLFKLLKRSSHEIQVPEPAVQESETNG